METCVFCDVVERKIPSTIIFEDDEAIAIKDIYPKAEVHILVVPKKHTPSLNEFHDDQEREVGRLFLRAKNIAAELGISKGYKIVVNVGRLGGQSVDHFHVHLMGGKGLRDITK